MFLLNFFLTLIILHSPAWGQEVQESVNSLDAVLSTSSNKSLQAREVTETTYSAERPVSAESNLLTEKIEPPIEPSNKFVLDQPYVPLNREYVIEFGTMWEKQNLYWLGGTIGFHLRPCWFLKTENCQQYFDITSGLGGREGQTHGLLLGSLRWQFVNYPAVTSPYFRLIMGSHFINQTGSLKYTLASGVGVGLTMYLHEYVDFQIEYRIIQAHLLMSQLFLGMKIKIDDWVEYFYKKIKVKIGP